MVELSDMTTGGPVPAAAAHDAVRVLAVTNMYPTPADPALGTFVAEQVSALRAHPRIARCDVLFINGRVHRWNYVRGFTQVRDRLRNGLYDVIHAHYGLTGAVATSQSRVPVVVTYHTGDIELTRWQRAVSRWAGRRAAANICVSLRSKSFLGLPAEYLPCGIDLAAFAPKSRIRARRIFGVPEGALAVLFPSTPSRPKKRYPRFVSVCDALRERGHHVHELRLEGLTRAEVPHLLAAADVMVLTSMQEGSPLAVMEAMASGLPVVATPVGDVMSMLADAEHARVLDFDAVRFADAVEAVVNDAPKVRHPFTGARRFDQQLVVERLVEILSRAARWDPPAAPHRAVAP
jgi:teichuronic acid biosynthesis glycosyltransferase TuaC